MIVLIALFFLPRLALAANISAVPGDNLQTKINSLNAGDTLTLGAGTYNTNNLAVTKTGTSAAWYTIQGPSSGSPAILHNTGNQNMFNVDNAHYVKIANLEITNFVSTEDGVKFTGTNSDITVENCYIHNIGGVGINCSSIGGNFQRLTVRHCTITATGKGAGATGEGMYLGHNGSNPSVINSLIENNYVHHTGGSQGDGIELNVGGVGNTIRDNVVHNTNYPCIFIENNAAGTANIVERNVVWASANEALQVNGNCIVRNNIVQGSSSVGLQLSGTGIECYNNVLYASGANNAVYFGGNLTLIFVNNIVDGPSGNTPNGTVRNNYWKSTAYGTNNVASAPGYNAAAMNFYPTNGAYVNAGWGSGANQPADDFNTTVRTGLPDIGAYELLVASNPGWAITTAIKVIQPYTGGSNQAPVIDSGASASPNPVVNASTTSVSVTAHDPDSGPAGLTYTWSKLTGPGSVTFSPNGTGAASGSTATFSASGTYTLQVSVSDSAAATTSATGSITVTLPSAPSVTTPPANQSVTVGQTATFSVGASGTPTLTYQWQKNGSNIGGATGSSYTTPATVIGDNGATFRVVVTNGFGSATSSSATLTVNAAGVAPSISANPANQAPVTAGATATFSVTASGTATLTYQWQKNGSNIGGATGSSYTTPATVTGDSGSTFRVVVTNGFGSATSSSATLTVNAAGVAPSISANPANRTVTAGATATFSVTATGSATLTYQWQKNGSNIGGATGSSYTTPATVTGDSGSTFRVVVTNGFGSATSSSATLTVNAAGNPITVSVGSIVFSLPPGTTAATSQTITLQNTGASTVTVTLTDGLAWLTTSPTPSVTLTAGQTVTVTVTANPAGYSGVLAGTLTLTNSPGGQVTNVPVQLDLTAAVTSGAKKSGCSLGAEPETGVDWGVWLGLLGVAIGAAWKGRAKNRPLAATW